ncbi:hypothetical protein MCUN1_001749 [Malassezia cuniculi]|uniref:Uncharacterized protein n=1 Tax=Malassezia cuniculi TaxID=948313 RepID=A0AAF0J6S8_9BASI|nr:hypothetical protein MCUN1_001749 [Malassezia cuniculi]
MTSVYRQAAKHVTNPRVIYRGGPYMRTPWFLLASASFALAGLNFASFVRDFLCWPLFPTGDKQPELVNKPTRYAAAGGVLMLSLLCSWYFAYAPSRMVTRLTVFPAEELLGVRTAMPPATRFLPRPIREMAFFRRAGSPSMDDPRERFVHLADVYRLQGSAVGAEVSELQRIVKEGTTLPQDRAAWLSKAGSQVARADVQDTLLLRVADARLAFQLAGAPHRRTVLNEPPLSGLRKALHLLWRGATDWEVPPNYVEPPAEKAVREKRAAHGVDTEPWFLDRAKFDRLFPLDRTRYSKKK